MKTRKTLTTLTLLILLFPALFVSGCTEELSAEKLQNRYRKRRQHPGLFVYDADDFIL